MKQQKETVTLTVAQAIIKYLSSQYIEIEGEKVRLCGGGFGIFGHGNVTCLGEALFENKEKLPLYRGQNEQGMGFAAAGYAKAYLRRRFMFCTASAGPGTANLLTSAALAHANRLPMLMLCGDTFITRLPDPVLQQLEHFGDPTLGVNDAFRAAAGGLPAEVTANWRTLGIGTVDVEFGFSCMGYEIAGGWGARIAQSEKEADKDTIVFTGDGSYLLMNSDIYSSVLTQKKMIILVLDNGGFAVINKLQNNTGNESFNNLISDTPTAVNQARVDFEAHAKSLGALSETVESPSGLADAFLRAKSANETYVIVMKVDPYDGWTAEGHTWWEVGTPHVSNNDKITKAHQEWESSRVRQRKGI